MTWRLQKTKIRIRTHTHNYLSLSKLHISNCGYNNLAKKTYIFKTEFDALITTPLLKSRKIIAHCILHTASYNEFFMFSLLK